MNLDHSRLVIFYISLLFHMYRSPDKLCHVTWPAVWALDHFLSRLSRQLVLVKWPYTVHHKKVIKISWMTVSFTWSSAWPLVNNEMNCYASEELNLIPESLITPPHSLWGGVTAHWQFYKTISKNKNLWIMHKCN